MRIFSLKSLLAIGLAGLLTGCSTVCLQKNCEPAVVKAIYTSTPVQLDGHLDEAAWQTAPSHWLQLGRAVYDKTPLAMQASVGNVLREAGEYRLLWDDNYLYVGAIFSDSDLHAYGEEDQLPHYLLGDLAEVFIKPESDTYYWELYATPASKMTTYFIPGRGCLMGELLTSAPFDLKVAAQVQGTLNNWHDRDKSWSMEMAIPRKEIERYGAKFEPGHPWRIFLARYNYSRYLPSKELSSFPQQAETPSFHIIEEYGRLELIKP
ncbi:MAG: hypothetical protein GX927_14225 [Lentisphaerae bacterium]|nr:hypothetical protein [Lentisphaerota bacterium]